MIVLEKPYRKEPIPGLRSKVDDAVKRRLRHMASEAHEDSPAYFSERQKEQVWESYSAMTTEEIYGLCPFSAVLAGYPGPSDWEMLGSFAKALDTHVTSQKEMNQWANSIIETIRKRLWPKLSPVSTLMA